MGTASGVIPITMLPRFAIGRPKANLFKAVVIVITPVTHIGPVTASPMQAMGRPFANLIIAPGPIITSPVAVRFAMVATGVGIIIPPYSQKNS
jgi:predicted membrane protein